jgi:hypothetical protein
LEVEFLGAEAVRGSNIIFSEIFMTKLELLVKVMRDGGWHSTEELVLEVGHRFSATKHVAEKQGYRFERRREGLRFEYRMLIEETASKKGA